MDGQDSTFTESVNHSTVLVETLSATDSLIPLKVAAACWVIYFIKMRIKAKILNFCI